MKSESVKSDRPPNRFLSAIFTIAILLVALATLAALLARFNWTFELASHFRMQYLIAAGICSCFFVHQHRWRLLCFALGLFLLNLWVVAPVYWPAQVAETSSSTVRILSANLFVNNDDIDSLEKLIQETNPDIIILSECDTHWMSKLKDIQQQYSQSINCIHESIPAFSIAAYSRIETDKFEIVQMGTPSVPSVFIELKIENKPVHIIGTHVYAPGTYETVMGRNNQLMEIGALAAESKTPCAVIGDLNISPWSPYFHDFMRAGNFRDSRQGFGNHASWPMDNWLLRIPIDHCVTQPGIVIKQRKLCPGIGSDHAPLLVELAIEK